MKKIFILFVIFVLYSAAVLFLPAITTFDRSIIAFVQYSLKQFPLWIPMLPDCKLYTALIVLPLLVGIFYFIKQKKYIDVLLLCSAPLLPYIFNLIVKPIIHRARPPMELQIAIHPHSYSYVSTHSLVTICLWGLVMFYAIAYAENKILQKLICIFSVLWILFVGFSRIWLGVHNPSDVLGAYLLGTIAVMIYAEIIKRIQSKNA